MINNQKKTPPLKTTYPLILENVNDLICILEPDYDYKFQLINENTYKNILGYSSTDLIGEPFLNYVHLDDVKRIVKILKKGSISLEDKELRFKAKDGKFLWFEAKIKKYEENNQKQLIIILRNISERKNLEDKFKEVENKVKELTNLIPEIRFWKLFYPKKYEEALRASYQMLQMVMDNIPEYLFWKDTNLVYLGCNNNYSNLVGIGGPENILGKTDNDLFDDKEKQDLLIESEDKILNSGIPEFNTISSWVLNSGESVWFDINRIPLRDSEEKIVGLLVTYDDITKKINAETKLKESEEKFRTISEKSLMGIFILQDDQIKYVNQVASTILGYTTDEIKRLAPKGYLNLFHPDERELVEDIASKKQMGLKGVKNYFQIRCLKKSGDIMWIDLFVQTFNYMGKPAGLITAIDITKRKDTEQMLKESEDIFRIITEQSFMGIAILQDNLVKYHNQRFAEITEFKSEEIKDWSQKDFLNIFHPYDKTLVAKQLADKQEEFEGQISHTQVQGIKKSGHTVWYEVFTKTIPYGGDYAEFIMLIDITESKESEDKLIDSEEKYRHLFESSPNMICLVDISREIIDFNTAFQNFSGYKKEELIGKDLFELPNFTPDARSTFIAKNKELLKRGYIQPIEIKLYDKKGHSIWVSLQASFVETGIKTLIEIIMRDITDRKLSENILQLNEARLEALLKLSQMGDVSEIEIFDYVAQKSVELTQSCVGCLLLMDMDTMSLEFCSCSNQFEPDICQIKHKHTFSLKETSLWKEAVLAKEAVIVNEYTGLKKFSTCDKNTEGKIIRYLTIPILDRNNIEAVIYVMNKESEYSESDVHQLRLFMDDVWKYLHQKRAREAVLESEKKYRNLLETSSIGILEFDIINKQLTYINPKLVSILGFEDDSYLDQQVFEKSIHPEDIKKFYDTSVINELELRIYDQTGNLKWLGGNRVNNYNEKEELIGFRVWLEDVTEKKMYEKLIYELNINFLSFTTDFQNNIEMLIETCNKLLDASVVLYCRKIMQEGTIKYQVLSSDKKIRLYDSEEFKKNLFISELFNENHDYIQSFYDINETNYNINDEFIKNYKIIGCNGKLIKSQEEFNSAICVFYREPPVVSHKLKLVLFSISGAIEIEERRWQVQQDLEKQSKLKTDLLSRTSHELKTPLISIKGFTELLLTLHSSKLDTDVISILGEIKEGSNRLERLISSLLESSRLDQKQLKLNKTTEDLSFLIKFCVKELEGLSELRKQTINLKIHEYLTSNFDKERIYEVISNLLLNAIKYTPPGGSITIRTEVKKKYYIVSVEDNGIGITEEEKKDQLFNQFGKIERYGKGWDIDIEGSGLGLYISKKLVELHGGVIWVESEGRNKGSKFFFSLPIISE